MPKRKNMICALRKLGVWPNGMVMRDTDDQILISRQAREGGPIETIICPQADARLIAKRINQFLDGGG